MCTASGIILSLADRREWHDTRGKWSLTRNPDRRLWLKAFFGHSPWLHGQQVYKEQEKLLEYLFSFLEQTARGYEMRLIKDYDQQIEQELLEGCAERYLKLLVILSSST